MMQITIVDNVIKWIYIHQKTTEIEVWASTAKEALEILSQYGFKPLKENLKQASLSNSKIVISEE